MCGIGSATPRRYYSNWNVVRSLRCCVLFQKRPAMVKAVKIFSYVQLGAIFALICLALFLLYVVKVDVQHYDEIVETKKEL